MLISAMAPYFIPGAHNATYRHPRDPNSDHRIPAIRADGCKPSCAGGGARRQRGDFEYGVPRTGANTSNRDRAGKRCILCAPMSPDAGHQPRGPIISGPQCDEQARHVRQIQRGL